MVTRFGAGGPPLIVLNMARGLQQYGYETLIAAGSCSKQDGDMSYLLNTHDKMEWIPSMSRSVAPVADFIALLHLIRLVRQYRPDIIHTHTAKAGILGRLAGWLAGTPLIVHTFHGNVLRGYFSVFGSWCFQKIEQLFAGCSDVLCVLSRQQQHEIAEEFHIGDKEKVRIVSLGLPLDQFAVLAPPPFERKELVVGWFGRLVAIKNVPLLIQIVEESLRCIPRVRFLIAGDGPERAAIEALAERSQGRVEYLAWQRDVAPVIERCDLLIQTSLNEGTPIVLIQGMAGARPFISTAVGGLPDMVLGVPRAQNGAHWFTNGVLAPLEAAPFGAALRVFAQDRSLLSSMGLAGRRWATANYSEARVLATTDNLYRERLAAKGHLLPPFVSPRIVDEYGMSEQLGNLGSHLGPIVDVASPSRATETLQGDSSDR